MNEPGVQERLAPESICWGCGPANRAGLRIASRWEGDRFVARFEPRPEHQAFPGVVNGGILGTLLDCHSNWCALTTLIRTRAVAETDPLPCTVTAEFHVRLKRPTPLAPLTVTARAVEVADPRVVVEAEVETQGKVTATCRGVFVAVEEGHPAFHRWGRRPVRPDGAGSGPAAADGARRAPGNPAPSDALAGPRRHKP